MTTKPQITTTKVIATNRKARFNYHIDDTIEAGLVLSGTEVKSLRAGLASLVDAYASFTGGEAFLYNMFINPYEQGNRSNLPERRPRKLLMHKQQIHKLMGQVTQKGYTVVALQLYFKGSRVKVELGLGKGKKAHDKRDSIKDNENRRELDRVMKESRRS